MTELTSLQVNATLEETILVVRAISPAISYSNISTSPITTLDHHSAIARVFLFVLKTQQSSPATLY